VSYASLAAALLLPALWQLLELLGTDAGGPSDEC
jgi:hypothetical protein